MTKSKARGLNYLQATPVTSVMGLAEPGHGLGVLGMEVVQCVQTIENSVALIADKATVVRVYLDPTAVAAPGDVTGEIAWSRDGAETYLAAFNSVRLAPNSSGDLKAQRHDLSRSLNFRLPVAALGEGMLRLRVSRVYQLGGAVIPVIPGHDTSVAFTKAPPFRIRVIGLRYKSESATVSPSAVHFAYLKSFLLRAYPVATLEWSHLVVDADFAAPFDDSTVDLANAQIAALRSREVSTGVDPRTHYYGLVDDNGAKDFMRGKAFDIPGTARPDVVASGPAGVPNGFAGDRDLSYADWYGAHELGHTFGRYHPGFPPGSQDASDKKFPYPNGCISAGDEYVGLDTGDNDLNLRMAALPGRMHHDVMTYADNQWLSAYTYEAILHRLLDEDELGSPTV